MEHYTEQSEELNSLDNDDNGGGGRGSKLMN